MVSELSYLPSRPGVYIFKGQRDCVLYVGKAKNLRNRLRSYFQDSALFEPRKVVMVRMVKDFSYIVTDNEMEALILEANLIKQYRPRFNIIFRDDKNYPYIKITVMEEWPRLEIVRSVKKDGNLYFGPYLPSKVLWEAITFIRKNFLIRTCGYSLDKPIRPCVRYQMKRCSAPCARHIDREEYMKIVGDVRLFLMGEKKELIERLDEKMQRLADDMRFEDAANTRDMIFNLRRAFESQKVIAPELGDIDVIGHYKEGNSIVINLLFVRSGMLIGARHFFLESPLAAEDPEIIHSFIGLFYAKEIIPPSIVLTNVMPHDADAMTEWLSDKKGESVRIDTPEGGKGLELLGMANDNARLHLNSKEVSIAEDTLKILKDNLNLANIPSSIGAFDVSTIHGSESVGAFVFWEDGDFKKDMYRHLKIKGVQGVDDYSMMKEIIERVFKKKDIAIDLIVIDGGKGHLEVARKVIGEFGIKADIIGIAKKPDRAFLLSGKIIDLDNWLYVENKASLLLKKIRDEAHRFAITFHKRLRDKRLAESPLEKVPGIGKKRRLELLKHFASLDNIKKASPEEISEIKGFSKGVAINVLEELKR
ncbi:excinuclease ABC subunit UvrC [Thermodesulfovibrionales bacterium]|nr:excinuclease ABC subunit UvrC [Thermodesulfovibrionales bacterium]MCL0068440.1 excinuclease ABC subunit UvrC [Thermodesulfovibrionales bacterium]